MTSAPPLPAAVQSLVDEAEWLQRAGQADAAARVWQRVLAAVPTHSRAASFFALQAFRNDDLAAAREWIERAVSGWPRSALTQAEKALILLAQDDRPGALAALLAALELDPGFVPARLDAGILLDEMDRPREAAEHFRLALERLPSPPPAPLAPRVERARACLAREQAALEAAIAAQLAPLQQALPAEQRERFDECLEIFLGRKRPQLPKPGLMHFPKLAPLTFFPREMFDWIEALEAQFETVRGELLAMLAGGGQGGFIPYVQKPEAEVAPGSAWSALNHRADWGAYFLYNQGARVEKHCAACPRTAALLDALPLVRIPGRGPTAFFSRLQPGTHIVPHHGATNTRLIAHLPLLVPPGCTLRVGNDTRTVEAGRVMVFDDSIEHEAWNRSGEDRIVLIFDVWNPFLSTVERELVTRMTGAIAGFYPEQQHKTDF